ncbi:hydrogen peroxide-inducible genes activator [Chryseobacterium sp. JK1]|uniref:hydrogen peroxide-inducible genes activator n=1 Tax=Chryseobacterium sp. JK1 TaxID=874294 RepID=UPI003D689DF1
MNFHQLGYVMAVCEEKNFMEAAEKCNVTQSTLSTMILKLEEEIGISIFDRKTKPVQLTKEGSLLVEKMKLIIKEVDDFKEVVKELKGELTGELKIGVIPTVAPFVFPLFLYEFSRKFPMITLTIREDVTENIKRDILNRTLDIGFLSLPIENNDLVQMPLYDEHYKLYSYVENELIEKEKIDLRDINKEKLWLLAEGHCMRTQIEELCSMNREVKEWENLHYEAGSIDTLVRLVKQTKGLTLLPYLSTIDFTEEEKKYLFSFMDPVPARKIGLLTHKHFVKQKLLKIIRDEILNAVRQHIDINN